nr:F-box protein At5g49610-like [Ipomoea batatas]
MYDRSFPIVCGGYPHPDANSCGFRRLDLGFLPCPDPNHRIEVKGSCADLILCASIPIYYSPSVSAFYVCNQLTKQWIALPPPPLQFQSSERVRYVMATGFLCVPAPCSLCTTNQQSQCVDHSRYDCVVVHICVYPPISHCKYRLQLFSSQEWKSLVVSSPRPISARFLVPSTCFLVTYKGMLHMLIANYILVYDPYNCPEKFCRVIDMPTDVEDEKCFTRTLGLSQNRLCVTCRKGAHPEGPYYIWELEDYDMGKWSLVHKFYIRPNIMILSNLDLVHPNLDPKIKDTGFAIKDGTYFYWINSSGWSAFRGIVHSITQQWWATPVPPLIRGYTIETASDGVGFGAIHRSGFLQVSEVIFFQLHLAPLFYALKRKNLKEPECGKKLVEKRNNLPVFSVGRRWKQMLSAMPEEERGDEQRRRRTEHRCPEKRGSKRKSDTRIKDYFAPFNSG